MSVINPGTSLGAIRPAEAAAVGSTGAGGGVADAASTFKQSLQNAEETALETAVSGADPHAMVEAFANAEMVLNTAVTIRDRVVEAYQELLRMPV